MLRGRSGISIFHPSGNSTFHTPRNSVYHLHLPVPRWHGHQGHTAEDPTRKHRNAREALHLQGGGCLAVPETAYFIGHG